jgi:hypothetical protein
MVTAWLNYMSIDDILAIFPLYMNEGPFEAFYQATRLTSPTALGVEAITQSCIALTTNATFDFVDNNPVAIQKLYGSGVLEKALGAYVSLYTGKNGQMNLPAKVNWMLLNMRALTTNLGVYCNTVKQAAKTPEDIKPGK